MPNGMLGSCCRPIFDLEVTGKTAARLAQKFIDLEGVAGTRGDSGQHVWIYSTPDATAAQLSAALAAMHAESSVVRVEKVRRSDSGM